MKPAGNTTSSFASNTSRIERIAGKLLWSSFRRVKLLRDEKILISSTASFLKHTKVVCVLLQSNINLAKSNMCSLPIEYSLALSLSSSSCIRPLATSCRKVPSHYNLSGNQQLLLSFPT